MNTMFICMDLIKEISEMISTLELDITDGMNDLELSAYKKGVNDVLNMLRIILDGNDVKIHINGISECRQYTIVDLIKMHNNNLESAAL